MTRTESKPNAALEAAHARAFELWALVEEGDPEYADQDWIARYNARQSTATAS